MLRRMFLSHIDVLYSSVRIKILNLEIEQNSGFHKNPPCYHTHMKKMWMWSTLFQQNGFRIEFSDDWKMLTPFR